MRIHSSRNVLSATSLSLKVALVTMEKRITEIASFVLNARHQSQASHFLSKMMKDSALHATAHCMQGCVKRVETTSCLENIICWTMTRGIKIVSSA